MGKLTKFLITGDKGRPGYFREGEEDGFPWNRTDSSVWYSLLVVENGHIERYGFTASKTNKAALLSALEELTSEDEALLLGVWTGQYSTHLFVLNIQKAIEKLKSLN